MTWQKKVSRFVPLGITVIIAVVIYKCGAVRPAKPTNDKAPMSSSSGYDQLIDQYLDRLEKTRHYTFTAEQRAGVHELAREELFRRTLVDLQEKSPAQQEIALEGLWRFAMIKSRSVPPAPAVLTREILDSVSDSDLPQFLWDHILKLLEKNHEDNLSGAEIVRRLPKGLRLIYTLTSLDGEIYNGGFYQWFTNSSGQLTNETLEDLRFLGNEKHTSLVQHAIAVNERIEKRYPSYKRRFVENRDNEQGFWADIESNFLPELEKLDSEYYSLQESDSFWPGLVRYARTNPTEFIAQKRREP